MSDRKKWTDLIFEQAHGAKKDKGLPWLEKKRVGYQFKIQQRK
jgi:hypothetical protein